MLSNSAGRTGNCDLGPDPTLSTRVAQRNDHAYCGEVAAPAPVPVRREAGAVVVVASAVVLLAAWAFVRLRCATRARRRH